MCGIAGWISSRPTPEREARRLAESLLAEIGPRGPDGQGCAVRDEGRVGLVHTRLAIIDPLARSDQPMVDEASGCAVVFNGEIYNYRALRDELIRGGVDFLTQSDTEVVLRGYLAQGTAFFRRLRGMYAIVIHDAARRRLLALRDPLGIKPLYLAPEAGRVMFGSSPSAAAIGTGARPDPAAAVSVGVFGAVLEPLSPYLGVHQLAPGVLHVLEFAGERVAIRPEAVEPAIAWTGGGGSEDLAQLGAVLADSIDAHFTSDVPVAVFQSAGLDSTLISAFARKGGHAPTLLTIGFDAFRGTAMDEVPGAAAIAAQLGLPHRSIYLSRDEFEGLGARFLADMRTPTADAFNSYLAAWFGRREGFKVALSGVGADELFSGYPSFRQLPRLRQAGALARTPGAKLLLRAGFELAWRADTRRSPKIRFTGAYLGDFSRRYLLRRAYFAAEELGGVLDREVVEAGLPRFLDAFDKLAAPAEPETEAGVRALEFSLYLRNVLLQDADWAGMAHGVEIRTPFVDIAVLRGLCDSRLACAWTKEDLRRLMQAAGGVEMPPRAKTGFMVPHDVWSAEVDDKKWDPMHFGSAGPRAWNRRVLRHWFPDWVVR